MRTSAAPLTIEHALLGFIRERPVHGYDIYQQLCAATGLWQVWRLKQSQLYALLAKLEDAGHIAATRQFQEARPPRKIYQLTEAGHRAFEHWLATPVAHGRQMRIEFLAKLYFAHRQAAAHAARLIEQQSAACQTWMAEWQDISGAELAPDFFVYAVQQFRLNQIESFLAWLATCQEALRAPDLHESATQHG